MLIRARTFTNNMLVSTYELRVRFFRSNSPRRWISANSFYFMCRISVSKRLTSFRCLFGFFVILLAPVTSVPLQFPPLRRPSFVSCGYCNVFWPQGHRVDGVNERCLVRGLKECFWLSHCSDRVVIVKRNDLEIGMKSFRHFGTFKFW